MVQESLTEYINKLLKTGYSVETIRNTLINAGYSPLEVNQAISYVQKAAVPTKAIHITGKTAVLILSTLIILILLILGAIKFFAPETKTIQMTVFLAKTELYPGETLSFIIDLTSGESRESSTLLTYALINRRTGATLAIKQDSFSMAEKKSIIGEMNLPADAQPGDYFLQVTLSYEGRTTQNNFDFKISAKPTTAITGPAPIEEEFVAECPTTCDDYNKCTTDYCEKGICRHSPIMPCCGNGFCESGENKLNCIDDCAERTGTPEEIIAQARLVAKTNAENAAILCTTITRQSLADDCFSQIASSSGKSALCENIQDAENKDRCYISFALDGDFSICNLIKNKYMSNACYSLQKTEQLKTNLAKANVT
ncbi:MAG: hypothetical protein QW666_04120 [Candidatus Woesearchaeota archaeon]